MLAFSLKNGETGGGRSWERRSERRSAPASARRWAPASARRSARGSARASGVLEPRSVRASARTLRIKRFRFFSLASAWRNRSKAVSFFSLGSAWRNRSWHLRTLSYYQYSLLLIAPLATAICLFQLLVSASEKRMLACEVSFWAFSDGTPCMIQLNFKFANFCNVGII